MIATTLKREEGIPAKLPEKSPEIPQVVVKEKILEIYINKNEEIRIENEYNKSLADVKEMTKQGSKQLTKLLGNPIIKIEDIA